MNWHERARQLRFEEGKTLGQVYNIIHKEYDPTIPNETIRSAIRRDSRYKQEIIYEDRKPLPTSEDIINYYNALKNLESALDRLDTKQVRTTIRLDDDKPIGIAFWGDWHIGARGVDYNQFDKDKELIFDTDGLYCVGTGDYKDNQNALIHPGGVTEQTATPGMQDLLVSEFFKELSGKMLAAVRGCHDDWDKRLSDKDFLAVMCDSEHADCVNLWHGGGVNINLGKINYKIRVRHKYKGESELNTTNAQRRLLDAFGPSDVIALGHKHYPDLQVTEKMKQKVTFLRSGTYKIYDEHGQKIGGYQGTIGVPIVILFPDEKRIVPFRDLRDGVAFLNYVRS
jgi:predicted phosphodiesterase